MHGGNAVGRFQLDEQSPFNENVGPKSRIDMRPIINDRDHLLPLDRKTPLCEVMSKAAFIGSFEKPRPERPMQFETAIN